MGEIYPSLDEIVIRSTRAQSSDAPGSRSRFWDQFQEVVVLSPHYGKVDLGVAVYETRAHYLWDKCRDDLAAYVSEVMGNLAVRPRRVLFGDMNALNSAIYHDGDTENAYSADFESSRRFEQGGLQTLSCGRFQHYYSPVTSTLYVSFTEKRAKMRCVQGGYVI